MVWGSSKKKEPKEREPMGYIGDIDQSQLEVLQQFKKHNAEQGGSGNPWFDD